MAGGLEREQARGSEELIEAQAVVDPAEGAGRLPGPGMPGSRSAARPDADRRGSRPEFVVGSAKTLATSVELAAMFQVSLPE